MNEYRKNGKVMIYIDESWVFEGMKFERDWIDPLIKENPSQLRKKYHTSGPKKPPSHGKRSIVIGAVSDKGVLVDSFKFIHTGSPNVGDYHGEMNSEYFENWIVENIHKFKNCGEIKL